MKTMLKVLTENLNPVSLNNYKVKTVFGDYKATQISEADDTDSYTTSDSTKSREWETAGNDGNPIHHRRTTTVRRNPISPREKQLLLEDKMPLLKIKLISLLNKFLLLILRKPMKLL